mmetsp:Transcript_63785/g.100875  ORF Transcript_63785/g.100875 Transcript_63785/m.100875 type:complete len:203 (+) Transcript_63785:73-681(+)
MATYSWEKARQAMIGKCKDAWLVRQIVAKFGGSPSLSSKDLADAVKELSEITLNGAISGVRVSHPWHEFFGEFAQPDNPRERLPSNLEYYAGNYINLVVNLCLVVSMVQHSSIWPLLLSSSLQGISFLGICGSYSFWLAFSAQCFLWLIVVMCPLGIVCGLGAGVLHAYFRRRVTAQILKEKGRKVNGVRQFFGFFDKVKGQ